MEVLFLQKMGGFYKIKENLNNKGNIEEETMSNGGNGKNFNPKKKKNVKM